VSTRSWISAKQRHAAKLLLDGMSGYRALMEAGYSRWTARKPAYLLRRSWGLRQALVEEQQARNQRLRPAPKRRKYDRRPTALAIQSYCFPENGTSFSNVPIHRLYDDTQRFQRLTDGLPAKQAQKPPAFMADMTHCPECGRSISRRQLFLGPSGNYVCPRCAGV
jgi:hypothetical protein